ncbi:class I SAM-dependent methyltransferase [Leptolyngbya sp. DQ-M1]|uniref:class I SAM-dependent methyltransferase n=1 Tax=Leptolyngbya sp. DQ-M1 TaxID=2933920 RepID=UPI0032984971
MPCTAPAFVSLSQCAICGNEHLTPVNQEHFDMQYQTNEVIVAYDRQTFWLNQCSQCGFIQPEGLPEPSNFFDCLYSKSPTDEAMAAHYAWPYKDWIFQSILSDLGNRLPHERRTLLDVGTNVGRMLFFAKQARWAVEAIELNADVARFAAEQTGVTVHAMNAYQLAQTNRRYDAITLTDVLEHIPDPVTILSELKELLSPGGWIAVKVPCGINQLRKEQLRHAIGQAPDAAIATNLVHVNHFNPKSLKMALTRAGFEAVSLQIGVPEIPPMWSSGAILSRLFRTSVYVAGDCCPEECIRR